MQSKSAYLMVCRSGDLSLTCGCGDKGLETTHIGVLGHVHSPAGLGSVCRRIASTGSEALNPKVSLTIGAVESIAN